MKITKRTGIAGQYSLTAATDDGVVTFTGNVYGGPVVMTTPSGIETFVSDPGRFGDFGEAWVRRFFGERA
jgi:hypothetical protein